MVRKAVPIWACAALLAATPARAQIIFETYSNYHHILVQDQGGIRTLFFDQYPQSLMSLRDPAQGAFEYIDFFHLPMVLDPTITRVLMLGLGGGSAPKIFLRTYPNMIVEVAEIDPVVQQVAKQYFFLPDDPRLRVTIADGRVHLQRSRGPYGAIFLDAYGSGPQGAYLPYHLATQEFFRLVWDRLENGGIMAYNAVGAYGGLNDDVIRHLLRTMESVFQSVYVFQAASSINTLYIAQKIDPPKLAPNGTRGGKAWPEGPWLQHPLGTLQWRQLIQGFPMQKLGAPLPPLAQRINQVSRAQSAPRTGQILTDNYAPVDLAPGRR